MASSRIRVPVIVVFVLLLAGCSSGPGYKLHYTLKEDPKARPIKRAVLLPVDVDVSELTLGGSMEEVPEWSQKAEDNVRKAVLFVRDPDENKVFVRHVDSSSLEPDEQKKLEEHLALFTMVASNALWTELPGNNAWQFKQAHFDYTIGDGMSFLKDKYDIDAGLIVIGEDVISSSGRKTAAVVGAVFGVGIPMGYTLLIGGLVDFKTGDILWLNHVVQAGALDLREPEDARNFAMSLMSGYPGLPDQKLEVVSDEDG